MRLSNGGHPDRAHLAAMRLSPPTPPDENMGYRLGPVLLALAAAAPLAAQTPDSAARTSYSHQSDAPHAAASRLSGSIRVDGVPDEAAWQAAQPLTGFRQLDPTEGAPASERTEIRVLYDEEALYIGAWMYDRSPVSARLGRRDGGMSASDWLTVIIDSNHDHRSAFGFELNPAGTRRDQTRSPSGEDDSWDPVWQSATSVTDSGWFAEMRIPFSQLRFSRDVTQTWGLQVERQIARNQEFAVWSFTPRDQPAGIPRYGHLTGLSELATGKRLEIMPYVVARAEYVDQAGNPFRSDREHSADAGLDLKYRVASNLTLDATINPDFGQVEVDPAVINLSAFETFFSEKRPFFIEGSELFRFGQDGTNSVFYSRRIGRQPTLRPQAQQSDLPDATRILGAAKLTGRSAGGWAIGMLNATTRREEARFIRNDQHGRMVVEPLTNFFVGRLRREARQGQSAFGGFLGAVNRDLPDSTDQFFRSAAYSGGVDFSHQWDQRTWTLQGYVAGSHVRGTPRVMLATQQLPYHYFQRPDASHLDTTHSATSLTGAAARIALSKRVGRHWSGSTSINTISPGYEVSDLGFQRRADRTDFQGSLSYQETRPGTVLRRYSMNVTPLTEFNYGGENISNRIFANAWGQLLNYWEGNVNFGFSPAGTVDDRLTRGGPAAYRPGFVHASTYVASDRRRSVVLETGSFFQRGPGDGSNTNVWAGIIVRPKPHWDVAVSPSFSVDHNEAQFIRRIQDPSATHTYGYRYVFAGLDQRTLALDTRLNYTFSPGLSLQVYAQPLIASGAFGLPKEFAAPRTFDFLVYGRDVGEIDAEEGVVYPAGRGPDAVSFPLPQQDFNIRSLRGNAVLRWEWRPGSTLFVAWQQTRSGFERIGDFNLRRDTNALFDAAPDNILLVKLSYWLNP
jgi:hypothetical protein